MADEDSRSTDSIVSCGKSYSDPLRVAAEGEAGLSTPAACCDIRAKNKVSHLDELHVSTVVYKSIPRLATFWGSIYLRASK